MKQNLKITRNLLLVFFSFLWSSNVLTAQWSQLFSNVHLTNDNNSVVLGYGAPNFSSFYKLNVRAIKNRNGIYGRADGKGRIAIYGYSDLGWAGYFNGNGYVRGSLGVGTTTLTDKLNVVGDIGLTGNIKGRESSGNFSVFSNTDNTNGAYINFWGTSSSDPGRISIVANGGGGVHFFNRTAGGWTQHMLIRSDGGVGIGTSNVPSGFKLAVRDGIVTEEVKVELCGTGGWCDYVFEEDYDLTSLEEVEAHIKAKGHLHKTPSAKEVEANGLLLKEMTINQQEKIEEIFLHLIEMKKENEALKATIKAMELKLAATEK